MLTLTHTLMRPLAAVRSQQHLCAPYHYYAACYEVPPLMVGGHPVDRSTRGQSSCPLKACHQAIQCARWQMEQGMPYLETTAPPQEAIA